MHFHALPIPSLYDGHIDFSVLLEGRNMAGIWRGFLCGLELAGAMIAPSAGFGELAFPVGDAQAAPNPLTDPSVKPGKVLLFDLEARFAKDVLRSEEHTSELQS